MRPSIRFLLVLTVLLAACSSHEALHERYQPLARAVQQGNGFFENVLDQTPSTPVTGSEYMATLQQRSSTFYALLEPYDVEVLAWQSSEESGFSVTVYDDDLIVLHDCNNTQEIDGWYYEDCGNTRGAVTLPPCVGPVDFIDE